jgi:UV excision repair protein RAD23
MKLVLKSLKNQLYEVDINSFEDTVLTLKENLSIKHGFDVSTLKLLLKGVILDNSKKLSDYKVSETDNIIMMNMKAKPIMVTVEETKKEEVAKSEEVQEGTSTKKDYSNEIASLMELGFPYERARHAIRRTKGDLQLAMEMLFNNLDVEEEVETLEGTLPKENIIQSIASICKIAGYNNPNYVRNILGGLEQSNPEVALAIKNNQEDFNHLMAQPITQEDVNIYQMFTGKTFSENVATSTPSNTVTAPQLDNSQGNQLNSNNQTVNSQVTSESLYNNAIQGNTSLKQKYGLSDSDYEAVLRLKEYGFGVTECIETYLACDRDEMASLNILLDSINK